MLKRIAALHARDNSFWSRRRALLSQVSENRIYLDRDAGRNLMAELKGVVSPYNGGSVIEGEASMGLFTWFFPLLLLPPLVGIFLLLRFIGQVSLPPGAELLSVAVGAILCGVSLGNRNGLVEVVRDAVGDVPAEG